MRSTVAKRLLAKMPEETKIFADKYADLVILINQTMHKKGYTQKKLADILGKRPSEIHKWLNGEHNFTLRSIAKLEAELGVTLLEVPEKKEEIVFQSSDGRTILKAYHGISRQNNLKSSESWTSISESKIPLMNVG